MSSVKILHIADTHFGRKYINLSSQSAKIRNSEVLLSFESVIERFDSDIVLLAGDIFDSECNDETINFVRHIFKKFSNKKFFIACGNHDPLGSVSVEKLFCDLPQNVVVFGDCIEKIVIPEKNLCIHGVSFSGNYSYASLLGENNFSAPGMINIMVMHGDVSLKSSYNPINEQQLLNSGVDYFALGHVHTFSGIKNVGNTCYAYPGVFEPGGFDECGDCGVIYGTVYSGKTDLDFYPSALRKYNIIDFDISKFLSNEEIISRLKSIINCDDLYKINLSGNRNNFIPDVNLLKSMFKCFYLEINDCSSNSDDIMNYSNELSLKGKTAIALNQLKDDYDVDVFNNACDILTNLMCRN